MARQVIISGLGPVCGLGIGIDPTWEAILAGRSAIGPLTAFDAGEFPCRIGAQVQDFKISNFVPKSYRKATKVMARDIEIAVAAADLAARDAGLQTKGTVNGDEGTAASCSYPSERMGAQIGAGLIAADLDELTAALAEARNEQDGLDMHKWGLEGMNHLTPLWMLKYLPNMLACHVTIIHDAQGPSNTITCGEASGLLSIGESLRVIQRGAADLCFCGGAESKLNPMAHLRQVLIGWLNCQANPPEGDPTRAIRPFSQTARGTVIGEGGGIVILESWDSYKIRTASTSSRAYAQVVGFGASQTVHRAKRNMEPDPQGRGIALAMQAALRDAQVDPAQVDLVLPFGLGVPVFDQAEAAALRQVFGDRLASLPVVSIKPLLGNCGAGAGALDVSVAAKAIYHQVIPPILNTDDPLPGLNIKPAPARSASLRHVLTFGMSVGGQNAALVLKRIES